MIIGIDLHKTSRTANAVDAATNTTLASPRIDGIGAVTVVRLIGHAGIASRFAS